MSQWLKSVVFSSFVLFGLGACGDSDSEPTQPAPDPDASVGNGTQNGSNGTENGATHGDDMCPRAASVCGNDVIDPGESCEPPGTETCDADCQRIPQEAPDAACDLTGHWAVEKVTVSAALGIQATSFDHMYYHLVQDGEQFEIVDSMDCGFFTDTPLLNVTLSAQTREALRCRVNSNGRTGSSRTVGDACEVHFDTWYTVRGLSPQEYWLDDDWAAASTELSTPNNPPPERPNCTCDTQSCQCDDTGRYDPETGTPGWDDWEGDGGPGITVRPGNSRWFIWIRDWDRFHGSVAQGAAADPVDELELEVDWWNIQGTLASTQGALVAEDEPDPSARHYVTLKRLDTPDRNAVTDQALCQSVLGSFQ